MELKPIKTKREYEAWLDWIDAMFEKKVKPSSPEGQTMQVALLLMKQYEDRVFPIPVSDPIDAVKQRMKERGLKNKDLVGKIGTKGYVSAVLNKKKPLTLELARLFHKEFGISAEVFLS